MQLTSLILFFTGAAVMVTARPEPLHPLQARQTAAADNATDSPPFQFACDHFSEVVGHQLAEISTLKQSKISVPPYLVGYYTAVNSGREEIGCQSPIHLRKRELMRDPCEVVNEQHARMMALVNRFTADNIGVAPFLAGFLSATLDGKKVLGCLAFTGQAVNATASPDTSTDSSSG